MITAFHGNPNVIKNKSSGSSGILKHHRSPIPVPNPSPPQSFLLNRNIRQRIKELNKAEKSLRKVLAPLIANHKVNLSRQPLSLRIRLNAKILYPSGQAKLSPHANKLLITISGVLKKLPQNFPIVIQGYTNKKPIHTAQFPSNWKLSVMRAVSVVHLFQNNGIAGKQLSAQGFSKYHPVDKSNTAKALRVNRRVAILIHAPHIRKSEPHISLKQAMKMIPGGSSGQKPGGGNSRSRQSANIGHKNGAESRIKLQQALQMVPKSEKRLIQTSSVSENNPGSNNKISRSSQAQNSSHGGHKGHGNTATAMNVTNQTKLMKNKALKPIDSIVSQSNLKLHISSRQAIQMLPRATNTSGSGTNTR